jgi:hypothetical protein
VPAHRRALRHPGRQPGQRKNRIPGMVISLSVLRMRTTARCLGIGSPLNSTTARANASASASPTN